MLYWIALFSIFWQIFALSRVWEGLIGVWAFRETCNYYWENYQHFTVPPVR
jgi:hypothetical protein